MIQWTVHVLDSESRAAIGVLGKEHGNPVLIRFDDKRQRGHGATFISRRDARNFMKRFKRSSDGEQYGFRILSIDPPLSVTQIGSPSKPRRTYRMRHAVLPRRRHILRHLRCPMKKILWKRRDKKHGYRVQEELLDGSAINVGDFRMICAYTRQGDFIGTDRVAEFLIERCGIKPQKIEAIDPICTIGFCESEQKWYGWSSTHIFGFGLGDEVREDDYCANAPRPYRLPVGFTASKMSHCRKMASAFARATMGEI